ncbi:MAG: DUF1489 family protein [Paracoccaceae bacterium]
MFSAAPRGWHRPRPTWLDIELLLELAPAKRVPAKVIAGATRRLVVVTKMATLNLIKLCVGTDSVDSLRQWQDARAAAARAQGKPCQRMHVTRAWPRRAEELLQGGSLYWVIKGFLRARQPILGFSPQEGSDGIRRCGIILGPEIIRTRAAPRRPFQGWRYLDGSDAPPDLRAQTGTGDLPGDMALALAEIGLI